LKRKDEDGRASFVSPLGVCWNVRGRFGDLCQFQVGGRLFIERLLQKTGSLY
jgi:hypothetical protein